jgi:L-cysteine:1D-myo-inositol 2-amino-2-deoxy-alpha-D-glucopyranoside ligase
VISWPSPHVPAIPGTPIPLTVVNAVTGRLDPVRPGPQVGLYVCGITPYDATHLGHAATYITFDVVNRILRDNGHEVVYVQNITDVDDPLLERAARDGVDWQQLAQSETALFREDMTALSVLPPQHYIGVVDSIEQIAADVSQLLAKGSAYRLPPTEAGSETGGDIYFDLTASPAFGKVSGYSAELMHSTFAQRGGDPERPGKRQPLDPLLWRAARPGEPSWPSASLGPGRPGWHIECTTIALRYLGMGFEIQGGGTDLLFPHHDMSAAHAQALTGESTFARHYLHQAMVGLAGQKMSKSRGNLVLVSALRQQGHDPMAIRLLLLAQKYAGDWSYQETMLTAATERLEHWRAALSRSCGPPAGATVAAIRTALSTDLDAPGALHAMDAWARTQLHSGGTDMGAPGILARALDALLGVRV